MSAADGVLSFADMTVRTMTEAPAWDHPRGPAAARILVGLGAENGMTESACLAGTALSAARLADPATQVEAGQELTIARNLLSHVGDRPGLGADAGRRYTVGALGVWGFALMSSPTVREVIRLGVRYAELSFAFIRPIYEEGEREAAVVFADEEIPADVRAFFVERELAKIATMMPLATGMSRAVRLETTFTGDRAAALRARMTGADLRTGMARHRIVFDRAILDAPLPQADEVTARELEQQCLALLEQRRKRRGVAGHVRSLILAELDSGPTTETVAAQLHVVPRTLRRQLEAEGTSFRELIDEVRATIADQLLAIDGLTLADIAGRLGYHDAAGFTRAYRRWTGGTPRRGGHAGHRTAQAATRGQAGS